MTPPSDDSLDNFINHHISPVKALLKEARGQFMLVSPDPSLLELAVSKIRKSFNFHSYKLVEVKNSRDEAPSQKIFILRLSHTTSMEYQRLLYFYFELPLNYDCFVCILTDSSIALNLFEKRVMSRFKNRVFFVPYFESEADGLALERNGHRGLLAREQQALMDKYHIPPYTLSLQLSIFEPLHIALLIMSFVHRITMPKVHDYFKVAVSNTPELKGVPQERVMHCALDILESGLVNENGVPLVSFNELKEYVNKNCPNYLKGLMASINNMGRK